MPEFLGGMTLRNVEPCIAVDNTDKPNEKYLAEVKLRKTERHVMVYQDPFYENEGGKEC